MSVAVDTRSKRNLPKPVVTKNDKIKKKSNCANFSESFVNDDNIEYDCTIKIKESFYNPEYECVSTVKEISKRYFDVEDSSYQIISVEEAVKKMASKSCCILDVRDCRNYQNGHIKGSRPFNCQKRTMALRAKKSWNLFLDKLNYETIIVYNQKGEKTNVLDDFIDFVKKDFANVYFVQGGYEEFLKCSDKKFIESAIPEDIYDQYHYSPTNEVTKSTDVLNATITEILPFVYLGNEIDSKDLELLLRRKITHILNVTTNVPFAHEGQFVHKRLSATDCNKQDMRTFYNEAFDFIDEAVEQQHGKVLVHCWAGVSRSATIVAAYILKHTNLSVLQTISFLQSKRTIVEPNFNFLGQLERYYCDLEKGVEKRSPVRFKDVEDYVKKAADINRVKDISLSGESSNSESPLSPVPTRPYFNFLK